MENEVRPLVESEYFEELCEKHQVLLHKFYIEGKTLDQIAKDFDEPKVEVRSEFTEAVTKLVAIERRHKNPEPEKPQAKVEAEQPIYDIVIKESEINLIKKDADKVIINANAEIHLVQLLKLQGLIEEALTYCKERLAEKASELDPDFKAIVSDTLKIMYRAYGSKYALDESDSDQVPEELISKTPVLNAEKVQAYCEEHKIDFEQFVDFQRSLDTKALDSYMKKNTTLPVGIKTIERKKQLSISLKKGKDVAEQ